MIAPSQIETCSEELIQEAVAEARSRGMRITIHAAQTMAEHEELLRRTGETAPAMLDRLGVLGPDLILGHCIFLDHHSWTRQRSRDDLARLARSGTSVAHCPVTFARSGMTLESLGAYRRAGVNVGIGTDSYPFNMLEEMREALICSRVSGRSVFDLDTGGLFSAATIGGAQALGRSDIGRLAAGCQGGLGPGGSEPSGHAAGPRSAAQSDPLRCGARHSRRLCGRTSCREGPSRRQPGLRRCDSRTAGRAEARLPTGRTWTIRRVAPSPRWLPIPCRSLAEDETTMGSSVYVINPNSSQAVTAAIDQAVAPLRSVDGPDIVCLSLAEGPPGIQSQRDVDGVIMPMLRKASELEESAGAFVIACFSDPGLHALREQSRRRVFGIAECGVLTALTLGQRFGVIAILPTSIPRHLRYFGAMGVMDRFAADLPIGLSVAELSDEDRALSRMVEVGRTLKDAHGAGVLVMGCAGMARYRAALEEAVGIPVVEPTQAAVAMAVGHVRLSQTRPH